MNHPRPIRDRFDRPTLPTKPHACAKRVPAD